MKLDRFLKANNISSAAFAKRLQVSVYAVRKWRRQARIPRSTTVAKIRKATKGAVGPDSWY